MDELCLFSHLGFTYTTYITVKGGFFLVFRFLDSKKEATQFNYKLENEDWVAPYISMSIQ